MTEAEANRLQIALCRAEVDRITASGERYHNGRIIGELSRRDLEQLQRDLSRIAAFGDPRQSPANHARRPAPTRIEMAMACE
jgi:hypothetical protein